MAQDEDGLWEVWTKYDSTPGSKNNYVVAGEIQTFEEAKLFCNAPEAVQTLRELEPLAHRLVGEHPRFDLLNAATAKARAILARIGGDGK